MRVLLKLSGEALKGKKEFGVDEAYVQKVVEKIKRIKEKNVELALVIGGGNIYRGSNLIAAGVTPSDSHNLSMLSTVFNGVILKNFLENAGVPTVVMNPLDITFLEPYNKDTAKNMLQQGVVTIFVGGTGNPYFTTDTGGVLRALEIEADYMIKATKVDGIYTKDPVKYDDAEFLAHVSYDDFIKEGYRIMDQTAVVLAKENNLPLKIVNLSKEDAIQSILDGKREGSTIGE